MEQTVDFIKNLIKERMSRLQEQKTKLMANQAAMGQSLSDTLSRIHELSLLETWILHHEKSNSGPKVKSNIQLGNIEECFQEDMIREIVEEEEDYFDGY